MVAKWVYRKSDGVFLSGGFFDVHPPLVGDPPAPDFVNYGVAEFLDADQPDIRLHRFDAATGKRPATSQELSTLADADISTKADASSRQKDILATCALIAKKVNPTAWANMTADERKAAAISVAKEWRDLRIFIEKNV